MYEVMRRGWTREDLEKFLEGSQGAFVDSSYTVEIYRSPIVEELYGKVEQKNPSLQVLEAFKSGRIVEQVNDYNAHTITPMVAKNECLSCHTNAKVGDVLGAVG